jgi:small subunit ribosomal protein S8
MVSKAAIEVAYSKPAEEIAKVLKDAGFISEVKVFKESGVDYKKIKVGIIADKPLEVIRVSKPGQRIYRKAENMHKIAGGMGVMVVSTSRGIMRSEEAKKRKLGGEVICQVW